MSIYAEEYGYFFDSSSNDRTYSAGSFEDWLKPFFTTGVFTGGLQVTAQSTPDMTVNVSAGFCNIEGKVGRYSSSNSLTLAAASGTYDRIDTIVLRRDDTNRCISLEVVTGIASSNPVPTAPTRTATVYELVLAQILVGTGVTEITGSVITDTRSNPDVCGIVAATVTEMDFSQFTTQFNAWFAEFETEADSEYAAKLQELADALDQILTEHSLPASVISYSNASSGLTSLTVQNAVDELSDIKLDAADGLKMRYVTVATSGWTAGTMTSASGKAYTYYYDVSVANMTGRDFVDISNGGSASSYTGNYAVESLNGAFRIWVASQPSAETSWFVYYKVGMTAIT